MTRIGIIGSGMIARFHALAIRHIPEAELVAIYGRNVASSQQLAAEFSCQVYHDLNEFLADESIEIVTIATPSGDHLTAVMAAAERGKHIICEKPLEINTDRINRMIASCEQHRVVLSGIFNRRFNPAVQALKKAIDKGRFGELSLCEAAVKWYRTDEYYASSEWKGTKQKDGGGALMNQAIHTIDLLLYLAGPVIRVCGSLTRTLHKDIEVEDTAVAILEFKNGARGVIQGSTACWSSTGHPAQIQLCGSEGSVFMSDDRFTVWDFKVPLPDDEIIKRDLLGPRATGLGANDPSAINTLGHEQNFRNVISAIRNGTTPAISGYEALKPVRLINAIYESADQDGKWISI